MIPTKENNTRTCLKSLWKMRFAMTRGSANSNAKYERIPRCILGFRPGQVPQSQKYR